MKYLALGIAVFTGALATILRAYNVVYDWNTGPYDYYLGFAAIIAAVAFMVADINDEWRNK